MKKAWSFLLWGVLQIQFVKAQWQVFVLANASWEMEDIYFVNDSVGYGCAYHKLLKTVDWGETWNIVSDTPFINGPFDVWFVNENIGFMTGFNSLAMPQVSKTINGGLSWGRTTLPTNNFQFDNPTDIYFMDNNVGFVVCWEGLIFKTTNQGANWNPIASPTTEELRCIEFADNVIGFIGAVDVNFILKSINSGSSWSKISLPGTFTVNDIEFLNTQVGYLACDNSTILKTTDGGSTWAQFSFGTSDAFSSIHFFNNDTGIVAGGAGTIAITEDGGDTWTPIFSGVSESILSMNFPSEKVGYMSTAGSPPKVMRTTDGGGLLSVSEKNLPGSFFTVFPNPAEEVFTIKLNEGVKQPCTVKIYDLAGMQIMELLIHDSSKLIYLKDILPGTYLLFAEPGNKISKPVKLSVLR